MFHASTMVDMARTPEEVKQETAETMPAPAGKPSVPTYPYGLCISFDDDALEKLKLDGELPAVGTVFHFCAEAKVTSASMSETERSDGTKDSCSRVECQIMRIGIPGASEGERSVQTSVARQGALYGKKEAAAAAAA